jgi:poly-beta-1,6-N-acetyl-D-glucosamine synthase
MQWLLLILIIPYIYLLLKIYRGLLGIKSFLPSVTTVQFVSVIIACRNEEKNLQSLLQDISGQDFSQELFEVIIIDDNSTDKTYKTASEFRAIKNLKVLRNSGNGKKPALRTGVAASSGDFIITTDADCRMGKKWVSTIMSYFAENRPDMIICPVSLDRGKGFLHRFQELEYLSLQGVTAGTAASGNPVMCNGSNLAFTKDTFNKNSDNLHDEILSGDDVFLLHSIKKDPVNNISWLESQEAVVITGSQDTIGSFIKQRARWTSKVGTYKDMHTRLLAIVTFVTVLLQWFLFVAGIFNTVFLPVLLAVFLLKSIPDYLVIRNTAARYGKKSLLFFFLPGQIIYPLYVISVFFYFLIRKNKFSPFKA